MARGTPSGWCSGMAIATVSLGDPRGHRRAADPEAVGLDPLRRYFLRYNILVCNSYLPIFSSYEWSHCHSRTGQPTDALTDRLNIRPWHSSVVLLRRPPGRIDSLMTTKAMAPRRYICGGHRQVRGRPLVLRGSTAMDGAPLA